MFNIFLTELKLPRIAKLWSATTDSSKDNINISSSPSKAFVSRSESSVNSVYTLTCHVCLKLCW